MSEGDKSPMEKKFQSPAPSQRDAGGYAISKSGRPAATVRKDFSGSGRSAADFVAASSRRQPTTQQSRCRNVDKRPRARGPNSIDQKEEVTKSEPSVPEYGSVQTWGSKKSNLNHLLNFHYESRDLYSSNRSGNPAYARSFDSKHGRRRATGRSSVPYNKERFLQANCQFVVCAGKDYSVHALDPDILVEWDLIEQVRISSYEVPSCPICLFAPKAAKITRCGHIYCWPCMLHYLSLDDRTWRKCPICYEAVHEKDLKSVAALETHHYIVGDFIEMKLMKKSRGCTRVAPASDWTSDGSYPCKISGSENTCYAKLLIADTNDVKRIVNMERWELEQELRDAGESTLEGSYIASALKSLEEREVKLNGEHANGDGENGYRCSVTGSDSAHDNDVVSVATREQSEVTGVTISPKIDQFYLSAFDETVSEVSTETCSSSVGITTDELNDDQSARPVMCSSEEDNEPSQLECEKDMMQTKMELLSVEGEGELQSSEAKTDTLDDAFYFYQAADGQHIYMHALNIRCMVKQYGSLRNCPSTVMAKLVEMEPVSMDEDLRRRLRYLNHLPLTCEFIMAEIDLQPPIVSQQVLDNFAEDLEKRRRDRVRKARDEKKRAYRIQAEENRKMGIDPTTRIVRSDYGRPQPVDNLPAVQPEITESGLATVSTSSASPDGSNMQPESVWGRGPRTESTSSQDSSGVQSTVPSFAQMLKTGKTKPEVWPRVQKVKETGAERSSGVTDHSDNDEYSSLAPRHQNSLSDAIQAALDNYSRETDVGEEMNGNQKQGVAAAGKKKKGKKLLFSTSLPRSS